MNPKLFIGLLTGIPMAIVLYTFYDSGIHNKWQLYLFLYAIFWCIMPSLIIILKLDLFGVSTKIKTWLDNKVDWIKLTLALKGKTYEDRK